MPGRAATVIELPVFCMSCQGNLKSYIPRGAEKLSLQLAASIFLKIVAVFFFQ